MSETAEVAVKSQESKLTRWAQIPVLSRDLVGAHQTLQLQIFSWIKCGCDAIPQVYYCRWDLSVPPQVGNMLQSTHTDDVICDEHRKFSDNLNKIIGTRSFILVLLVNEFIFVKLHVGRFSSPPKLSIQQAILTIYMGGFAPDFFFLGRLNPSEKY